jgi:choline-sulfatase
MSKNGCLSNGASLRSDRATFAHSLSNADYETVLCGRMHFNGPDQRHGFRRRLVGDITPTIYGGTGSDYGVLKGTAGQSIRSLQLSGPGNSNVVEYDKVVTAAASDFLAEDHDSPFFLMVGLYGPHCPYVCPPDLYDYYYGQVAPPKVPDGFQASVHPAVRHWYRARRVDEATPDDIRRCRAAYYGLVELLDGHVGTILDAVESTGHHNDTAVIYLSDHGDMIGENGLFWKSNLYEGSVRVPLTIRLPEDPSITKSRRKPDHSGVGGSDRSRHSEAGRAPGTRFSTPVSLLDVAPTLISLAGAEPLPEYDGVNISPLLGVPEVDSSATTTKGPPGGDREIVSICTEQRGGTTSAMMRKGSFKLVSYHGHADPQLFDLETDPLEQNDLGADSEYSQVRADLESALASSVDLELVATEFAQLLRHAEIVSEFGGKYEVDMLKYKENWRPKENPNYLERRDHEV